MDPLGTDSLLSEIKKGNELAYAKVFNSYFVRLSQFAHTYVMDKAIAKNMAQDAFMKLWENRSTLRENTSLIAYLLVITKNNCLDYLKHQYIEQKYSKKITERNTEFELNYNALKRLDIDLLDYDEIQRIIENTLNTLPPQCRQVFSMSRFESLSNAEISQKLNISIKAVEGNITRALKIFRVALKDYIAILILLNI